MVQLILYLFIPLSLVLKYLLHASPIWVFGSAIVGIVPLAMAIQSSTENIADIAGPSIGGLLNVSFGNAPELILALFVLIGGSAEVVKGQITGSIIGNSLLGLGLAVIVGTWRRQEQHFNRERAGELSTMLILVVIGLMLPALFNYTELAAGSVPNVGRLDEEMSLGVSAVLILLYIANLIYTLFTHNDVYSNAREEGAPTGGGETTQTKKSIWRPIAVLLVATAFIAWESELISGGLQATASQLGLSTFFLGIIVLSVTGNAAEYVSAIVFARQQKMSLVMPITVGSSIQVGLLVAPLLVIISYLINQPMNLVFANPLELIAIAGVAFTVNAIAKDGKVNWFEGVLLVGIYMILAIAFFFVTPV